MRIVFVIPFVPIPRVIKRINTATTVGTTSVIFWDRGTDDANNLTFPPKVHMNRVIKLANEGQPLKRLGSTFLFCREVFSFLKKEDPSCIHVTKTDMLLITWFYCITRRKRPKVIYEVSDIHSMALNNSKSLLKIIIKKILFILESIGMSVVDRLIVTSESFWTSYYKSLIPKKSVLFLPNTPRESIFKQYRAKENGRFQIGFIGKVRYKEQLKLLIDASELADIDVLIAGNGIDLNEIIEYSKKKNNVYIYGPYNYEREIASLYGKIDCVYSMYDTKVQNVRIALPNRLYEAAICGLPLIVSKGTQLSKIVQSEEIGIAVEDRDKNELVEALIKLKNDSLYRNKLKNNGRKFYEKWRYDIVNQKLEETYSDFL